MILKDILKKLDVEVYGDDNINIEGIENNSLNVKNNYLFICIKGFKVDGHKFIKSAIENGATAIMVDKLFDISDIKEDITIIKCNDTRLGLAISACNFYDNPSEKFKLIGITGTKGKTTTTYILKSILEQAGKKVGLIGTIENSILGEKIENAHRTTPESIELQRLFYKMVEKGVEYVIMEVSSQALKLNRVAGCEFDIGVFTNFSKDHIGQDEHPSMEDYFCSKMKLFNMCKKGFINVDDNTIKSHIEDIKCPFDSYSINNESDYIATNIEINSVNTKFGLNIGDEKEFCINIPGKFSVYNSLAAICVAKELEIQEDIIAMGLKKVKVPGRSELVENSLGLTILIDYAHSPDSLENILTATKSYTKGNLICVFGCGGDRDNKKRPIMGEISGKIADITIITSDNPRTEDPKEIVKQIEEGIKNTTGKYEVIVDRTEAMKRAIEIAGKDDIIILAGKGHETYQEINGQCIDFDERVVLTDIIKKLD